MRAIEIIGKYIAVIFLGILIFRIDSLENISTRVTIWCIVAVCLFKAIYFVTFLFRKIIEVSLKDIPYYKFLLFMALNVALIVVSFSIDYFCLSEIDSQSFIGGSHHLTRLERYADFLYFSILTFTNFGYDQVSAATFASKFILSLELIVSFTTIIFILSDFISLKESLGRAGQQKKEDKP